MIDLHVHTTASDGTDSPAEVVRKAQELGLSAIAITDHDTTRGVAEAQAAAAGSSLRVIAGIEISAGFYDTQTHVTDVHVLGYFVDPAAESFNRMLAWILEQREVRNRKLAEALTAQGYPMDLEALRAAHPDSTFGRMFFARELMDRGIVSSISEAFDRFIGPGGSCYVPKTPLPLARAMQVILEAGGLPVPAHPYQYQFPQPVLERMIRESCAAGAVGLEVQYSLYTEAQQRALQALADRFGLLPTGGSDYHGMNKPHIQLGTGLGWLHVPDEILTALEARHTR